MNINEERQMFEEICALEQTAQTRYCSLTKQFNHWIPMLSLEEQQRLKTLYEEYYGDDELVNEINWKTSEDE